MSSEFHSHRFPGTKCPVTGQAVFTGTTNLLLSNGARVICPSCGKRHYWDAANECLVLTLDDSEPQS